MRDSSRRIIDRFMLLALGDPEKDGHAFDEELFLVTAETRLSPATIRQSVRVPRQRQQQRYEMEARQEDREELSERAAGGRRCHLRSASVPPGPNGRGHRSRDTFAQLSLGIRGVVHVSGSLGRAAGLASLQKRVLHVPQSALHAIHGSDRRVAHGGRGQGHGRRVRGRADIIRFNSRRIRARIALSRSISRLPSRPFPPPLSLLVVCRLAAFDELRSSASSR